ncbi:MAG TPA: universal stress protein [Cytophagaceae bacterium]
MDRIIKKILFPTDFSSNAKHAMDFAVHIAQKLDAELILFHAVNYPIISTEIPYDIIQNEIIESREAALSNLENIRQEILANYSISIEYLVEDGPAGDQIIKLIDDKNIDLVVMGNKGGSFINTVIFGSTTAKVIEKARCPVLAIPMEATNKNIQNILYATDYLDTDIPALKETIWMAHLFHASITLLHVTDSDNEFEKFGVAEYRTKLAQSINYNNIIFKIIKDEDIEAGIERYVLNNQIDLLVMNTRKRGTFEKYYNRSLSEKISYHIHIPLMVFHDNREEI